MVAPCPAAASINSLASFSDIDRPLIGRATYTAGFHFNCRCCILKGLLKYIERGPLLSCFNSCKRIVKNALSQAALSTEHELIGKARHISAFVLGIRYIWPPYGSFASWHDLPPHQSRNLLRSLLFPQERGSKGGAPLRGAVVSPPFLFPYSPRNLLRSLI